MKARIIGAQLGGGALVIMFFAMELASNVRRIYKNRKEPS